MVAVMQWLGGVEQTACSLYTEAGKMAGLDPSMRQFLLSLAADERLHCQLMNAALEAYQMRGSSPEAAVLIDDGVISRVEVPLRDCLARVEAGDAGVDEVLRCIVDTEFSEWNDLFLYVMVESQPGNKAFQRAAAAIQKHETRVRTFLEALPGAEGITERIRRLAPIWSPRYLVVEDDDALRLLYQRLFEKEAMVVTACNGREALDLVCENYYDVVVSDLDMPVMDGISLFQAAVSTDQNLAARFVLCSGKVTGEAEEFCKSHGIFSLQKPVSISVLRAVVRDIAASANHREK